MPSGRYCIVSLYGVVELVELLELVVTIYVKYCGYNYYICFFLPTCSQWIGLYTVQFMNYSKCSTRHSWKIQQSCRAKFTLLCAKKFAIEMSCITEVKFCGNDCSIRVSWSYVQLVVQKISCKKFFIIFVLKSKYSIHIQINHIHLLLEYLVTVLKWHYTFLIHMLKI